MNRKIEKVFMLLVAFAVVNYSVIIETTKIYAASFEYVEEMKKNCISEDIAYNIAQSFIVNAVENEIADNWNEYSEAWLLAKCYDTNRNISAYVYNVTDTYSNAKCGYIVIGGSRVYSPIIEFAENEDFMYTDYLSANDMLIYEGGIYYYGYNDRSNTYYYCDSEKTEVTVENINKCYAVSEEIKTQWYNIYDIKYAEAEADILINRAREAYYDGAAGERLGFSKLNKQAEEGYEDVITLSNLPSKFYTMDDFYNSAKSDKNFYCTWECCAPTAAINLLYYYNRNSTYYSTFDVGDNNKYKRFKLMYSLMKTDDSGTSNANLVKGLTQFLQNYTKFKNSVVTYRELVALNAEEMIADLKLNRPVILRTVNHEYYKNHCLVCVGIRVYNDGSIFYAVANGRSGVVQYMNSYTQNAVYTDAVTVHLFK